MLGHILFDAGRTKGVTPHVGSVAENVGPVNDNIFYHDTCAEGETEEVVRMFLRGLRVIEEASPQGDYRLFPDDQVFNACPYLGGVMDMGILPGYTGNRTHIITLSIFQKEL